MFLNLTGKSVIGVLDRNKSEMSATWPLPAGDKLNVAMAFDEPDHRLFVTTRNPGELIVLNSDNGKVITSLPAVGMVDDMSYDAQQKRLFLAGDGVLDVFEQKDADRYDRIAHYQTAPGARTGLFVPEWSKLFVAIPHRGEQRAEVLVYQTK